MSGYFTALYLRYVEDLLLAVIVTGGGSKTGVQPRGSVRFIGETQFAAGVWVGVALDTAEGKNDGSVNGQRYFKCKPRRGLFVRHEKLQLDEVR